jgi:hypothetical protein
MFLSRLGRKKKRERERERERERKGDIQQLAGGVCFSSLFVLLLFIFPELSPHVNRMPI